MMRNNVKIAITGGIGSGKSTVLEIIRGEGFPVYSCDEIYNQLLSGAGLTAEIGKAFNDVVDENGKLDRKKLGALVFSNAAELEKLNNITHPKIFKAVFEKMQDKEISFCEVPLLFESGYEKYFDNVIVVMRDENDRILSVMQRDGLSQSEAKKRMNNQQNYTNCNFAEYYVIHNSGNLHDLKQNVINTITEIKEKYLKNF